MGTLIASTVVRMASILIVEDNRDIALILTRHLSTKKHQVTIARNGAMALQLLAGMRFDCILLDLMMPVMTGTELLHRVKQDPALAAIPIVLVSARVGEGRTHILSERDADRSVGKPFTRRQILDAVDAALAQHPEGDQPLPRPTPRGGGHFVDLRA